MVCCNTKVVATKMSPTAIITAPTTSTYHSGQIYTLVVEYGYGCDNPCNLCLVLDLPTHEDSLSEVFFFFFPGIWSCDDDPFRFLSIRSMGYRIMVCTHACFFAVMRCDFAAVLFSNSPPPPHLLPGNVQLEKRPALRALERVVSDEGFKTVVTLRLAPVLPIPLGAYNYGASLDRK